MLNLTFTATMCWPIGVLFNKLTLKRHLFEQRLNSLVVVKYNLKLEMGQLQRQDQGNTYDPLCVLDMDLMTNRSSEKKTMSTPYDSWIDIHVFLKEEE